MSIKIYSGYDEFKCEETELCQYIEEEEKHLSQSISMSRRIRGKSMDHSKSFTENIRRRQKSLNNQQGEKLGKRMLSINEEIEKNSLVETNFEDMAIVDRREKLIQLAKLR